MQIIKPQQLVFLNGRYQIGRQSHLGISVVAGFYLSDPQHFANEAEIWAGWEQAPLSHRVLDLAEPKPFAEYLLAGHAGVGEEVTVLDVSATVGRLSRRWRVQGEASQTALQAQPFLCMPLDHPQSYGGEGCADNPLGRGHRDGRSPQLMVMHNDALQHSPLASPGPVPQHFPLRKAWLDRVAPEMTGEAYLTSIFPGYPQALDRRYFQLAPPEQRLNDAEWPDEVAFDLAGFRPDGVHIGGVMPRVRARLFYSEKSCPDRLVSLEMQRKTLWLLPDCDLGLMVFTGQIPLDYLLHEPLANVMAALECLDSPRDEAHFHDVFARRKSQGASELEVLYDPDLMPQGMGMNVINATEHNPTSLRYRAGVRTDYAAYYQLLRQKISEHLQQGAEKKTPELEKISWEAFPQANRRQLYAWLQEPGSIRAEGEIFTAQSAEAFHLKQGEFRQCQFIDCTFSQAVLENSLFEYCQFENCTFRTVAFNACTLRKSRFTDCRIHDGRMDETRLEQVSFDGLQAAALIGQGTQWQGCLFDRVQMNGAAFTDGVQEGCSYSDCDLTRVALRRITLTGCIFKGCDMRHGMMETSELIKGSLLDSDCRDMVWRQCRLENMAIMHDCRFRGLTIDRCLLQQVGFRQVDLTESVFTQSTFVEANFEGANLSQGRFLRCELAAGCLKDADMQHSQWQQSALQQAVFYHADMRDASFDACNLVATNMSMTIRNAGSHFNHCLLDEAIWRPQHCAKLQEE
ncbi:TPA: pentapeptide repeat-containing protein [Serratia odorifera]